MTVPDLPSAFSHELSAGYSSLERGDLLEAFRRFERAHIIGQRRTRLHGRAHVAMPRVAQRRGECERTQTHACAG